MGIVKSAQCDKCGDIITENNPGVAIRGAIYRIATYEDKGHECWPFVGLTPSYGVIGDMTESIFRCNKCLINEINKIEAKS